MTVSICRTIAPIFALLLLSVTSIQAGLDWTSVTLSPPWGPRKNQACIVHDGKIWVIGGFASNSSPLIKSDVWFSEDGTTWTSATLSAPWGRRWFHNCVSFDGKIWLIGGLLMDDPTPHSDVWFSADGAKWTCATTAAFPSGRRGQYAVVFDGKIWVVGGGDSDSEPMNTVYWSMDGAQWTLATSSAAWGERTVEQIAVFDGKMWVLGGIKERPDSTSFDYLSDVWFSADGIEWTSSTLSSPWGSRTHFSAIAYDDRLWVMGGFDHHTYRDVNDVWYSYDGAVWMQASASSAWSPRKWFPCIVFDNRMWILGGGLWDGATRRCLVFDAAAEQSPRLAGI